MNEPSKRSISIEMVTRLQSTQKVQPAQTSTRAYNKIQKQTVAQQIRTNHVGIICLFSRVCSICSSKHVSSESVTSQSQFDIHLWI